MACSPARVAEVTRASIRIAAEYTIENAVRPTPKNSPMTAMIAAARTNTMIEAKSRAIAPAIVVSSGPRCYPSSEALPYRLPIP